MLFGGGNCIGGDSNSSNRLLVVGDSTSIDGDRNRSTQAMDMIRCGDVFPVSSPLYISAFDRK